jgi:hypothetical protein
VSTSAWAGRGSLFKCNTAPSAYVAVGQLKRFDIGPRRTTMVDYTNLQTAGNNTQPLAVLVDQGEVSFSGVRNPSDAGFVLLKSMQANLTLGYFQITLTDGTVLTFAAYVAEFSEASVEYSKVTAFSGKLTISTLP